MEISQDLINEFRQVVGVEASNDLSDFDCIRFLRARNGNVTKASNMALNWYTWWHTSLSGRNTDDTIPANILAKVEDHFEPIVIELCPHALEGFDKEGHPIYWVILISPSSSLSSSSLITLQLLS